MANLSSCVVLGVSSLAALACAVTAQSPQPVPVDPPVVNAPVAPEAIYVGRQGPASVSIIDLDGFGQGTGDPANTSFLRNPNVGLPGVTPPLAPGSSWLDAGGEGYLTLTRDDRGGVRHLREHLDAVGDIHIGQPLDLVFNNEATNRFATAANQVNPATLGPARGNTISVAPHPNPPRLLAPGLVGEEPTVTSSGYVLDRLTTSSPPCLPSPINLLPLNTRYNGVFYGPQPARPMVAVPYSPFTSRQQIGHFLYVVDRVRKRVQVVNSNRMTLLASIPLPDPHSAAMAPNLRWLAVSNFTTGTVSFVDTDPLSPRFHSVLGQIAVGRGPTGLAWQPEGEDLLVCNSVDNSVSIISASTFQVRRVLSNVFRNPTEVAVGARQFRVGLNSMTYFALIQNGDGSLVAYESGPAPIGLDGTFPLPLTIPTAMVVKARASVTASEFVIATRDSFGRSEVDVLEVYRAGSQWSLRVTARFGGLQGRDQFSGNQVADLAFDETYNDGASPDVPSPLPGLSYARHSGKGFLKQSAMGPIPAYRNQSMFVACRDVGKVDVLDLSSGRIIKRIDTPGVTSLSHYWRQ